MNVLARRFLRCFGSLAIAATLLLIGGGCQQMEAAGSFGQRFVDLFSGKTPINAAKKMEDTYFPDERRAGIVDLSNHTFGRRMPYTERYKQIAQFDKDWLVRATAIRALNRSRDTSATAIFITALSDESDIVRVEAAKALNNMPDASAVPELLKRVNNPDESRDVRIWSAAALHHYRTLEVARTLANQLEGREFGLAWQSRVSLREITGRDLQYNQNAWLDFLTGPDRPFG